MLQIDTSNSIMINGRDTGLKIAQRRDGTVIYTPESTISGRRYQEHKMPHGRYSTAHDNPNPRHATPELAAQYKTAGRLQLEKDVNSLVLRLKVYAEEEMAFSKKMAADVAYDNQQRVAGNPDHL